MVASCGFSWKFFLFLLNKNEESPTYFGLFWALKLVKTLFTYINNKIKPKPSLAGTLSPNTISFSDGWYCTVLASWCPSQRHLWCCPWLVLCITLLASYLFALEFWVWWTEFFHSLNLIFTAFVKPNYCKKPGLLSRLVVPCISHLAWVDFRIKVKGIAHSIVHFDQWNKLISKM